jgi:hypothetical protein
MATAGIRTTRVAPSGSKSSSKALLSLPRAHHCAFLTPDPPTIQRKISRVQAADDFAPLAAALPAFKDIADRHAILAVLERCAHMARSSTFFAADVYYVAFASGLAVETAAQGLQALVRDVQGVMQVRYLRWCICTRITMHLESKLQLQLQIGVDIQKQHAVHSRG